MSDRQRDLLLTATMLCIGLTPAWLLPRWLSLPWQIFFYVLGPIALWYSWRHAPWQPTPRAELERIVGKLGLAPGGRFCDLGAGDGRIVAWVHRATGADCTGIEASPLQWLAAQIRLLTAGRGARVRLGDLYRTDLSSYDAVYVWGTDYSVGTERFTRAVLRTMRPGARLVSYHYAVPGLEPVEVDTSGQRPLFVYDVPTSS